MDEIKSEIKSEIYISVSKVLGGYVISDADGQRIETSLNKVISIIKETLKEPVALRVSSTGEVKV